MTDAINTPDCKESYDQPILQSHGDLLSITGASPKNTADITKADTDTVKATTETTKAATETNKATAEINSLR